MKKCQKCKKIQSLDSFYKSKTRVNNTCKDCIKARYKERASEIKEYQQQYYKKYRKNNTEKLKEYYKEWKEANIDSYRKYQRYYQANVRVRGLKQRTPKWANIRAIKRFYENCPNGMEVDHIIPLRGKNVSGLHVETNLQYLDPKQNKIKGNKYDC